MKLTQSNYETKPMRKRSLYLMLAAGLAACSSDATTEPARTPTSIASILRASPEQVAALGTSLDDAATRLIPSLEDEIAQARLSALLSDLAAQVDEGDAVKVSRTLRLARRALIRLSEGVRLNGTDAADLGAVALVLDQAQALVNEANEEANPTKEKLLP